MKYLKKPNLFTEKYIKRFEGFNYAESIVSEIIEAWLDGVSDGSDDNLAELFEKLVKYKRYVDPFKVYLLWYDKFGGIGHFADDLDEKMEEGEISENKRQLIIDEYADQVNFAREEVLRKIQEEPTLYAENKELFNQIFDKKEIGNDLYRGAGTGLWGLKNEANIHPVHKLVTDDKGYDDYVKFGKLELSIKETIDYFKSYIFSENAIGLGMWENGDEDQLSFYDEKWKGTIFEKECLILFFVYGGYEGPDEFWDVYYSEYLRELNGKAQNKYAEYMRETLFPEVMGSLFNEAKNSLIKKVENDLGLYPKLHQLIEDIKNQPVLTYNKCWKMFDINEIEDAIPKELKRSGSAGLWGLKNK